MNEIERMAREAGCFTPGANRNYWAVTDPALARFAELVRAAERERSRKATQEYMRANPLGGPAKVFYACADAIRAGDPIDQAMANFGLAWAAPDSAAIRGN